MGGAAGKQKQKKVYVAGTVAKDEVQVENETSNVVSFAGDSFQDMVKQAAAISEPSACKPPEVESASSSPSCSPEAPSNVAPKLQNSSKNISGDDEVKTMPTGRQNLKTKMLEVEFSSDSESDESHPVNFPATSSVSTATSQQQEAALKAIREAKGQNSMAFGAAIQENYRQLADEREQWFKSIGLDMEEPEVVKAATRMPSSSATRAGLDGARSLREPDIMEEVSQWNARIKRDETHPALTAAMLPPGAVPE